MRATSLCSCSAVTGALAAEHHSPRVRAALADAHTHLEHDVASLSAPPQGDRPVTLGIGEPFTTTLTVTLIFALILSLPVVLWQVYGFLMPALDPEQRRQLRPLLLGIPLLFITGVAFGYFVVLPAAVRFFQNFNSDQFNVLVQASQYYKFAATTVLAMGLLFQVPVGILGGHPRRRHHTSSAAAQPPLCHRRLRCGRRAAARRRDHDAARDGAALPVV